MSATSDHSAAPTIDELLVADDAGKWSQLGFAVADGVCQLGAVRLRFAGRDAARGLTGWALRDIRSLELDGLTTTRSHAPTREPAGEHPNGVVAVDHVVVFSPVLDRTVAALQSAGLPLRRIREEPTPAGAPRQAFFRLGAEVLEVIQAPADAVERAGGADSPARLWGLAVTVSDLERTVAGLAPDVSGPREAVQEGRRIATLRRSAGVAVPLAFMSAG